jgi:hypothetical protein
LDDDGRDVFDPMGVFQDPLIGGKETLTTAHLTNGSRCASTNAATAWHAKPRCDNKTLFALQAKPDLVDEIMALDPSKRRSKMRVLACRTDVTLSLMHARCALNICGGRSAVACPRAPIAIFCGCGSRCDVFISQLVHACDRPRSACLNWTHSERLRCEALSALLQLSLARSGRR